ncbi:MAG: preprotein translocase subunit YajC [Gemmatimonadaceae bacterium]
MTSNTPLMLALFAPAEGAGGSTLAPFLLQIGLIVAIVYFMIIRPQQKQKREHEAQLRAVKKGDEVVTAGGIIGEIVHIRDTMKDGQRIATQEDRITIRTGESRIVVERGRIARVVTPPSPSQPSPPAS